MKALAVGGTADYVHILLSLTATLPIAKAIRLLKGNSSDGSTKHFRKCALSLGGKTTAHSALASQECEATVTYVRNQAEHHHARAFREEFVTMLGRQGFDYAESMLD
jgi:putative transposase